VDQLIRNVTFDVLGDYFGITDTPDAALRVWATRLFEFQFADDGSKALHDEVATMAPALRAHIDKLIASRRASGPGPDDVLGRCLQSQAKGLPGFSDTQIRCALIGFLVGGLPQPPMVAPQALEQLLRRPDDLAGAQNAARQGDDALLAGYVFEAMRFDPLAPALTRKTAHDHIVAEGTPRATNIPAGTTVLVAFSSAMMDSSRVVDPTRFEPRRAASDYLHFGYALHRCFGFYINQALLPLMLKPLLLRQGLRRAPGAEGHLEKRGPFADRLWVEFNSATP
jgi:cytochrome P450